MLSGYYQDVSEYSNNLSEQIEQNKMLAKRAEENLDMINHLIGSGMWYIDFDESGGMSKVFYSDTFRQMLGVGGEEEFPSTLQAFSDRLHSEDKEATLEAFWDCINGGQDFDAKHRVRKKDGSYEWFHARAQTARYPNGEPRFTVGTFINETEELRVRRALEEAYQAANRANSAKTEFMSNMSHDIRTPLNAIIGMTAIAGANINNPEKIKHCLSEITVSSKHLLGLINEVLDMNRIESGKVSLNVEPFEMAELINEFLSMAKPLADEKNQDFSVNISDMRHEKVVGDPGKIRQCLMNFLSNAVKYTPEGGKISLMISEKPTNRPKRGCYEFIFQDSGIGMSEEFMAKIFEPFARADDERVTRQQGTGLGMPITRNIIRMMNGDVKIESRLNEGSKFTATIFLELQDGDISVLNQELVDVPVLVVDDELTACQSTCAVLDELGMKSEWVLTGKEACERIVKKHKEQDDYFAVILDWKMPGMDGLATARAIREEIGESMPIIIISAYDWSDIEEEATKAGVSGFVGKPVFKSRMSYVFHQVKDRQKPQDVEPEPSEAYGKSNFQGKKILLAEDNEINAEITCEILGMMGLSVDHVWNGREAVELMEQASDGYYDLIFMDIQMPVMNGYEATKAIRASDRTYLKEVPIVAMSANAFAEDVRASGEAGMDEHISKPLDINRLTTVLDLFLSMKKKGGNEHGFREV